MDDPSPAQSPAGAATRRPMYEDNHECCSILAGRVRNAHHLLSLSCASQFRWFHRFYLVLDHVVEQHRVYKLYGGPQGFMISTNIAEPDAHHATTMYRFIRHLSSSLQHLHLPGDHPVDMVMAAASGELASGLLGTTSLTYQLVGRPAAVVEELVVGQPELNLMMTSDFFDQLDDRLAVSRELQLAGRYQLRAAAEDVAVYTPVTQQAQGKKLFTSVELSSRLSSVPLQMAQSAAPAAPTPFLPDTPAARIAPYAADVASGKHEDCSLRSLLSGVLQEPEVRSASESPGVAGPSDVKGEVGCNGKPEAGAGTERKDGIRVSPYRKDPFLRYEDPAVEQRYVLQRREMIQQDAMWSLLGFTICLLYLAFSHARGTTMELWQVLQFSIVPGLMMWLRRIHPEFYVRHRESVWFMHRVLMVLASSLPSSFAKFASHSGDSALTSQLLSYGTGPVLLDVLGRRLDFHMQLASSATLHIISLFLMGLHAPGTAGHDQLSPDFLLTHFLLVVVAPCLLAYGWDVWRRKAFEAADMAKEKHD